MAEFCRVARQESAREDLLAEAAALVERAEFLIDAFAEPVVIGFRADGCASLYFGQSPAYHFNSKSELRRAFVDPLLYKAERQRLVSLARTRTPDETALVRHELTDAEQRAFLDDCAWWLRQLAECLATGRFRLLRKIPESVDPLPRINGWLARMPTPIGVAHTPRVG